MRWCVQTWTCIHMPDALSFTPAGRVDFNVHDVFPAVRLLLLFYQTVTLNKKLNLFSILRNL